VKLATWNVNSIRVREARVLAWLAEHGPDVLCMQEVKVVDSAFPAEALQAAGYRTVVHGQKTYNGVAIASRLPIEEVAIGFDDGEPDDQSRLIAATIAGIRIVNVYVPNGQAVGSDKYGYKLDWMRRLRSYLERRCDPAGLFALVGDFNVAPEDRDVHDPVIWAGQVMCSEVEREALRQIVGWGLTDAFRQHHDEAGVFSWWDYRMLAFPKKHGLRIDHILASAALAARCTDCVIDRNARKGKEPSDHAPVIGTFSVP
jgi:exodeoxyribonuclease III